MKQHSGLKKRTNINPDTLWITKFSTKCFITLQNHVRTGDPCMVDCKRKAYSITTPPPPPQVPEKEMTDSNYTSIIKSLFITWITNFPAHSL